MIRRIIEKLENEVTFKYNNEEWKVSYLPDRLDIYVETSGTWTAIDTIDTKIRSEKYALKEAKKAIDGFNQYK